MTFYGDLFVWTDLLALLGVVIGAFQCSIEFPDYPSHIVLARFARGFHISIVVAIFAVFAGIGYEELMRNIPWVKELYDFDFPMFGYMLFVLLGMIGIINASAQPLFIKYRHNITVVRIIAVVLGTIDLVVITHLMSII